MGSIWMYLFPETVDLTLAEEWGCKVFYGLQPVGLSGVDFEGTEVSVALNMEDITPPSGSLGDPLLASAEKGERIVQRAGEGLVRFMSWFKGINPCVEPG